jgi:hypothetical protein
MILSSTGAVWGVEGEQFSGDPGASGVVGRGHSGGVGVTGLNDATGGIGVRASAPAGFGFVTDSNVQQARSAGGWAKAMVVVNGTTGSVIERCFNSTLTGPAATTPPCGFVLTKVQPGQSFVDFGFEIDDRFLSATLYAGNLTICANPQSANGVLVSTEDTSGLPTPASFYLVVF